MKNIVKNNEKMKELNVVKSEVSATLQDAEINSHATSDFELSFPLPENMGGKEVKLKINVTANVTSSVAAQEKLDEIAENRKDRILDGFGKLISLMVEKIPEIGEMAREEKKKNCELHEKERLALEENEIPYAWEDKFNDVLVVLRENKDSINNLEFLENLKKSEELDYQVRSAVNWAIAQVEKAKLGMLNKAQLEMLDKIGLIED